MVSDKRLLLHLSLIENVGPVLVKKILDSIGQHSLQLADLYQVSLSDFEYQFGFTSITSQLLFTGLADKVRLDKELDYIDRFNVDLVAIFEDSYPAYLKEIHAPPPLLYVQGAPLLDNKKRLAVVGARKGDGYGQRVVKTFIPSLVDNGWEIVSGGALGIDAMAHQATLDAGGATTAVIGSGLGYPYPASNKRLFQDIIHKGGSLVSPFPMMFGALPGNFPARNRIISGLSSGCLVVQAAQNSGACITAFHALEQGREVFAVPGSIFDELSMGCHVLITQGATPVMSPEDVLKGLGEHIETKNTGSEKITLKNQGNVLLSNQTLQLSSLDQLSEKIIAHCVNPISIEQLMTITNLSLEVIQEKLFHLQMEGLIQQTFIGLWVISK
ncbi:MAG TPA: DNA-processing protein DprA [Candidatus Babeliales bacterium]|nr:DNA-processing protein DprA [Candidatus Babeliales bacterium]